MFIKTPALKAANQPFLIIPGKNPHSYLSALNYSSSPKSVRAVKSPQEKKKKKNDKQFFYANGHPSLAREFQPFSKMSRFKTIHTNLHVLQEGEKVNITA